jgi:hypothetical protein
MPSERLPLKDKITLINEWWHKTQEYFKNIFPQDPLLNYAQQW